MSAVYDDVTLFNQIDKLLNSDEGLAESSERRGADRRPYKCIQLLAPYDGIRIPGPAEFRQVRCQDISPGGISFYSYRQPETKWVIVALGQIPFLFVVAEVRHTHSAVTENGNEFVIGCRFTKRLGNAG